jgi:hypothetical protein
MPRTIRVPVKCRFDGISHPSADRGFLTADGKDAADELTAKLDKRNLADQPGQLVFEFTDRKEGEIKMDCVFRGIGLTRTFVTYNNTEGINMFMNRFRAKGILKCPGKLVFEFISGTTSNPYFTRREIGRQICSCGHNRYAHIKNRHWLGERKRCDVRGCECKGYIKNKR